MTGIFRIATKEAIKEIILENGQEGRFGILLSDVQLEAITDRVTDLIETALSVRNRMQERMEQMVPAAEPSHPPQPRSPKTSVPREKVRSDSNRYEPALTEQEELASVAPHTPTLGFKLPRKRYSLTQSEKQRFNSP